MNIVSYLQSSMSSIAGAVGFSTEETRMQELANRLPDLAGRGADKIDFVAKEVLTKDSFKGLVKAASIARYKLRVGELDPKANVRRGELKDRLDQCGMTMPVIRDLEVLFDKLEMGPVCKDLVGEYLIKGDQETRAFERFFNNPDLDRTRPLIPINYDADDVVVPNQLVGLDTYASSKERALYIDFGYAKNVKYEHWNKFELNVDQKELILGLALPGICAMEKTIPFDISFIYDEKVQEALSLIGKQVSGQRLGKSSFNDKEKEKLIAIGNKVKLGTEQLLLAVESRDLTGLDVVDRTEELLRKEDEHGAAVLEIIKNEIPGVEFSKIKGRDKSVAFEEFALAAIKRKKAMYAAAAANLSIENIPSLKPPSIELPDEIVQMVTTYAVGGSYTEQDLIERIQVIAGRQIDLDFNERVDEVVKWVVLVEKALLAKMFGENVKSKNILVDALVALEEANIPNALKQNLKQLHANIPGHALPRPTVVDQIYQPHAIDLLVLERGHDFNNIEETVEGAKLSTQFVKDFSREDVLVNGEYLFGKNNNNLEGLVQLLKENGLSSEQVENILKHCDQGLGGGPVMFTFMERHTNDKTYIDGKGITVNIILKDGGTPSIVLTYPFRLAMQDNPEGTVGFAGFRYVFAFDNKKCESGDMLVQFLEYGVKSDS